MKRGGSRYRALQKCRQYWADMPKRIVIIQGHPDTQKRHYGHALADEYAKGAGKIRATK